VTHGHILSPQIIKLITSLRSKKIIQLDEHGTTYLSMALQPFVGPWPLFQFLGSFKQSVGLLGLGIRPSQGRYL
jgi:hypothetical protein